MVNFGLKRYINIQLRNFYHALKDFDLKSFFILFLYRRHRILPDTILLVEMNNCHSEVICGYIPYFQKLGYSLEIIAYKSLCKEKPFFRADIKGIPVFYMNLWAFNRVSNSRKLLEYKHIFITSSAMYMYDFSKNKPYKSFLSCFPSVKKHPSLFMVGHDLKYMDEFQEGNLLKKNRLITLGKFENRVFINPHLFSNVSITPKSSQTTFITIGAINIYRKNHQELIKAVEQLSKTGKDFRVIVVGSGNYNVPKKIRSFFEITGRLDFPKMFKKIEEADFFLPLLDENNKDHERYITTGCTGSAQLIYGFSKIPIIHQKFASFYRFDKTNSIVYTDSLAEAMKYAINLTAREYQTLQDNLSTTAKEIEQESLCNLQRILK